MLIVEVKKGSGVKIGSDIRVFVQSPDKVKLAVIAPNNIRIERFSPNFQPRLSTSEERGGKK